MATPLGLLKSWVEVLGYQALGFLMMAITAMVAVAVVPPQIYGDYWLLLSVIQVVSGVGLSWAAQSIPLFAREEARLDGDASDTLASAVWLQAAAFLALLPLGWLARPLMRPFVEPSGVAFAMMATAVALMALFETMSYALQAMQRFDGLGLGAALSKLGPLIAVIAIWLGAPAHPEVLLIGLVGGFAAALAVTMRAMPPRAGAPRRPSRATVARIARYGSWLPVAAAAGLLSAWMHVWFVRAYGGAAEAGVYGWAASLHALVGAALMPLSAVIAPHMIDLALKDRREILLRRADLFLAMTVLCVAAALAMLGLFRLAATALPVRYAGAGPILVLLLSAVPAQLMMFLAGPLVCAYPRMVNRTVKVNLLMAASNLMLNWLLTTRLGGIGAALAMSLSVWLGAMAFNRLVEHAVSLDGGARPAPGYVLAACAFLSVASAGLIAWLPPPLSIMLGGLMSALLLWAAQGRGLLRPLAVFASHTSFLPHVLHGLLTRFFDWCDTSRVGRTPDGTV